MKSDKRPHLPRGLHWRENSPYIWFTWRDPVGKQHRRSTETKDPQDAALFCLRFMQKAEEHLEQLNSPRSSYSKLPLKEVADLYFNQKAIDHSAGTIARERRLFRRVEKYFGADTPIRKIQLWRIEKYQQERSKEVSPTMKRTVQARTINYEMQLLRGVMMYAGCRKSDLAVYYKPLRQKKSEIGQAASDNQLARLINTAKENESWEVALYCAAAAAGMGCRGGEIKRLKLKDLRLFDGRLKIRGEIAKGGVGREPILMALAEWGLRGLLSRAHRLGATEPEHYLLPFNVHRSRHEARKTKQKWDPTRPMVTWVKSWRKLVAACQMTGFRFHDLRHTFRTQGAHAGGQLEVMMAQLGHMDRETSLHYVHFQQQALEKAKKRIERQQVGALTAATGKAAEPQALSGQAERRRLGAGIRAGRCERFRRRRMIETRRIRTASR
jgi:integrase